MKENTEIQHMNYRGSIEKGGDIKTSQKDKKSIQTDRAHYKCPIKTTKDHYTCTYSSEILKF